MSVSVSFWTTNHSSSLLSRTQTYRLKLSALLGSSMLLVSGCSATGSIDSLHPAEQAPVTTHLSHGNGVQALHYEKLMTMPSDTLAYQLTYVDLATGVHVGSWNERAPRAALSLIKLYIGHYVFTKGKKEDADTAYRMITKSDDVAADQLYSEYPESIGWVAKKYKLDSTIADPRWGYSLTSSYDVAFFLTQLLETESNAKVLAAMQDCAEVAADGTDQYFGTAILPGVQGSKLAWSNDKDTHGSASFAQNYVAVAMVNDDADTLTELVEEQLLTPKE